MSTSDPFRLYRFLDNEQRNGFPGQKGLTSLFERMIPHLLVRRDERVSCVCADPQGKGGDQTCTRCLGTGKVIQSLDIVGSYVNRSTPRGGGFSSEIGWEAADIKVGYLPRTSYPNSGDLLLEIGWPVPNKQVKATTRPACINNVYLIKQVNPTGLETPSFHTIHTVLTNTRKPFLEDILVFGTPLAPYRLLTP